MRALAYVGGIVGCLLLGLPYESAAQATVPPDTVATVFDGDTIPGMGAVGGVAVDRLGYVYVADFRNSVWRYEPGGAVELYADGLYGASGNAIGPSGELYQSSFHGNYVSRIERDGSVERYADGFNGPVGIAVGREGELYVCNCSAGNILRVGPDRTVMTFSEGELFACPNGITFDDQGDLYVVNFGNTHIVRITPDGKASSFAQIPGAGGNGHITFARGSFFVTKFRGHQVFRLDRDGSSVAIAGNGTPTESDGSALEAGMSQPNGIAAAPNGKTLWVNDLISGSGVGGGVARSTLRRIRLISLSDVLAATDPQAGADGVREAYRAYRTGRGGENTSADAIAVGFQFLSGNRVGDGLAIFALNAEDYPDDANSQFQLGEAYRYTGQPDNAIAQYRKTLRLNPAHPLAEARIALLSGS
jgi:sugar lactone lactonase YvrE